MGKDGTATGIEFFTGSLTRMRELYPGKETAALFYINSQETYFWDGEQWDLIKDEDVLSSLALLALGDDRLIWVKKCRRDNGSIRMEIHSKIIVPEGEVEGRIEFIEL